MQREIRVHGVSGTPPRDILYTDPLTMSPVTGPTKIYQRRDADPDYDTVAFHWASLTSGSPLTALWILLAPYALANAAGWMAGWEQDRAGTPRDPSAQQAWHAKLGRMAVRAAGMAITVLFVVQAVTAVVVLPLVPTAQINVGPIELSVGTLPERPTITVLVLVVGALFYWLVAYVSTRSHFPEKERVSATRLLFEPSGRLMTEAVEGSPETDDPAGAPVTDPRLWGVHSMLHRLRRLHLGIGLLSLGLILMVFTGLVPRRVALLCIFVAAFAGAWLTTHRPQSRWTWRVTSWAPLIALVVFVVATISIWTTNPEEWWLGAVHGLTFGLAAVLGLFVALSLLAGPLSVGALVLATFFGAVLGTTIGLVFDTVILNTNVLIVQGVGWVAVAMLALIVWLALAALVAAMVGHREPEKGATKPLSDGSKALGLIRRVAIEGRILFYAAGLFGLISVLYGLTRVWDHGQGEVGENAGLLDTIIAGLDPAALAQFPGELINVGITVALLGPGYFAFRSIFRGWRGGRAGEDRRRQVGILWDVGSFWPRWFHPLAPPGYGPRAIKDLRTQIEEGPPELVLAAHSQGSLISAVAIALEKRPTRFITYGSQLGILYPRIFPGVGISDLVDSVAGLCPEWINLWRDSDYIGGHYIDNPAVTNRLVTEGSGHSRYELTEEYRQARREMSAIIDHTGR